MSQNLSQYLSRRANGNGSSTAKAAEKAEVQARGIDETEANGRNDSGWASLDVLKKKFEKTNMLPPILSPILPDVYGGDVSKFEIPRMLSPTLPDIYDEKKPEESLKDKESAGKPAEQEKGPEIRQPVPQRPSKRIHIEEDNEDKGDEAIKVRKASQDIPKPPAIKRKSFEKIEHFGVHSYKLIETSKSKSLLLTLHVPSYYKNKKSKPSKPVGLGIKQASEKSEKINSNEQPQKIKKSSIFKTAHKEPSPPSNNNNVENPKELKGSKESQLDRSSLLAKNEEYLKIAKGKKHKGDESRAKNLKVSLAYFLDSIIIYLVGFSYEDQSRRLSKKLYNDKTWLSLISLIDHALKLSIDNSIGDIAGLCLQIKAVVYEHVCKILDEFIQLNNIKRKKAKTKEEILAIDENLINHFRNYSKYRELSKRSFIESESYLSVFKLQKKYPSIVESFQNQAGKNRLSRDTNFSLDPRTDSIQLPINTGVTLKEICAYSLRVMKQWCRDEPVKYNEWTF